MLGKLKAKLIAEITDVVAEQVKGMVAEMVLEVFEEMAGTSGTSSWYSKKKVTRTAQVMNRRIDDRAELLWGRAIEPKTASIVKESLTKVDNWIGSEDFIDDIIGRINRKQLGN